MPTAQPAGKHAMPSTDDTTLDSASLTHLAVPKGRIEPGITHLLAAAGIELRAGPRGYRPVPSVPGYEVKLLKPQTIVEMLAAGSRDAGFAGADWVAEKDADLVELLDTGLDPVSLVVAAPEQLLDGRRLPHAPLVVASEYERLTPTTRCGPSQSCPPTHPLLDIRDSMCAVPTRAQVALVSR